MRLTVLLSILVLLTSAFLTAHGDQNPGNDNWYGGPGFGQYPSLSPDGAHIVFSDRGDLWSVSALGGPAHRLTSHPADELRSALSPDGTVLAFESTRDGATNLYTMPVTTRHGHFVADGPIRRVTHWDRSATLAGFTPDGTALSFHARAHPAIYRAPFMYEAPLDGGPISRPTRAHGNAPRRSADGRHMVFHRGGAPFDRPTYRGSGQHDIWSLDTSSGTFTRLSDARSNEGQAFVLPDGTIVLVSSADGQNNVWRIKAGDTFEEAEQLTHFAPDDVATIGHGVRDLTVSGDGSTAAFMVWDELHTLRLGQSGAQPERIDVELGGDLTTRDRRVERLDSQITEVARHPSGDAVAVVARGEVLVRNTKDDHPTRRVTEDHARQRHIAWAPDGSRLYFTSDQDGHGGIWAATVALTRDDLTPDDTDDEAESADDDAQDADEDADQNETGKDEGSDGEDTTEEDDKAPDTEDDADEDDEKADDKDTKPAPNTSGEQWADALRFDVESVIEGPGVSRPMPAPDGSAVLYQRDRGDLVLRDLQTGTDRVLLESWNEPQVRWLPDSRHIVYSVDDLDFNADIWLMDVEDPAGAVNLTRHPDIDTSPRISDDGTAMVFLSDRGRMGDNWEYDTWLMTLDPALLDMTDYERAEHVKTAVKAAGKKKILPLVNHDADTEADDEESDGDEKDAIEFTDLDDAWKRVRRVTSWEGAEGDLYLTPGGDKIVVSGEGPDGDGLYTMSWTGESPKRITSSSVSNVKGDIAGKTLTFVSGRTARHATPGGGTVKKWPFDADADIEVAREQDQKFLETARNFGRDFYHPTMKGRDWDALTARYAELAGRTRTSQAFNRVVNQLFGEVNGSHTGIYGGFTSLGRGSTSVGYLGVDVMPVPGGYEVVRVLDDAPVDRAEGALVAGDVITGVDGVALAEDDALPHTDLRAAMTDTSGVETLIDIRDAEGQERMILVEPVSFGSWSALARRDEIARNQDTVSQHSDGRIGYLHIRGMNMPSVHEFERDLYAAAHGRDGLIIDVRDNGGGFTTDILLASLTAPVHAYTIPRGAKVEDVNPDSYPRDRRLLYAWSRPIVVLCNENSFSNAEIFSHAISTTGRGQVVGEETFGGVISTGAFTLIDGSRVRRPFRGWYLPDGTDMESRGAIPDVHVFRSPADEARGHDAQLEKAVDVLMQQLPDAPPTVTPRPAS